jgi:hypothetical protein
MKPYCIVLTATLTACAGQRTLSQDFGVATATAFARQADRGTAPGRDYPLYGLEGVQVRLRAQEAAAAEKSGNIAPDSGGGAFTP